MNKYIIFGLKVLSDIKLNCYNGEFQEFDVKINLCSPKNTYVKNASFLQVGEVVSVNIDGLGIYDIISGNVINIHAQEDADIGGIELYLLSQVFACLLIKRGNFPLHGSTLFNGNTSVTILGKSGSGKSTLSMALMKKGWKMIADDILKFDNCDGKFKVVASFPFQKIWKDTAKLLNLNIENSLGLYGRPQKHYFKNIEYFSKNSVEAHYFIELNVDESDEITYNKKSKGESFGLILRNTYKYSVVKKTYQTRKFMKFIGSLCNQIDCYEICRPQGQITINELTYLVEEIVGV